MTNNTRIGGPVDVLAEMQADIDALEQRVLAGEFTLSRGYDKVNRLRSIHAAVAELIEAAGACLPCAKVRNEVERSLAEALANVRSGAVDMLHWAPLKVGSGVGCYVVHHGQDNVSAHYRREDGCYCILEFGASRSNAQRFADCLNATRHVGQTVRAALANVGGAK